jgi:uncharacterized protein with HEPN domain
MTPRAPIVYPRDILDACDKIQCFIAGVSFNMFEHDDEKVYAVMLALEIIGEAAKQIPAHARQRCPQLPRRAIAGMRDKIAHQDFGVNRRLLWQTVQSDVPLLQATRRQMLLDAGQE